MPSVGELGAEVYIDDSRLAAAARRVETQFGKVEKSITKHSQSAVQASASTTRLTARTEGLSSSFGTLKAAAGALAASQVFGFLKNAANAALDVQRANVVMNSSLQAANREFGSAVGTATEWRRTLADLRGELSAYTNKELAEAIERTVTMTKRLGLQKSQMEEVIRRSADLAVGKTDLTGAVERVTAALRGEAESSELLGLTLNENYVKARALEFGLKEGMFGALDDVSKAQLRYLVFLEQTNEAQGRAGEITATQAGRIEAIKTKYDEATVSLGNYTLKLLEFSGILDLVQGNVKEGIGKFLNPFDLFATPKGTVTGETESVLGGEDAVEKQAKFLDLVQRTIDSLNNLNTTGRGTKATTAQVAALQAKITREITLQGSAGERLSRVYGEILAKQQTLFRKLPTSLGASSGLGTGKDALGNAQFSLPEGTGLRGPGLEELQQRIDAIRAKLPELAAEGEILGNLFQGYLSHSALVFVDTLGNGVADVLVGFQDLNDFAKTLGDTLKSLVRDLAAAAIKAAALTALAGPLGLAGGSFGSFFTGFLGVSARTASLPNIASAPLSIQLRGEFVQRGTDLVAVVNTTTALQNS